MSLISSPSLSSYYRCVPNPILASIFENIAGTKDVLNCRVVCKNWHQILNSLTLQKLGAPTLSKKFAKFEYYFELKKIKSTVNLGKHSQLIQNSQYSNYYFRTIRAYQAVLNSNVLMYPSNANTFLQSRGREPLINFKNIDKDNFSKNNVVEYKVNLAADITELAAWNDKPRNSKHPEIISICDDVNRISVYFIGDTFFSIDSFAAQTVVHVASFPMHCLLITENDNVHVKVPVFDDEKKISFTTVEKFSTKGKITFIKSFPERDMVLIGADQLFVYQLSYNPLKFIQLGSFEYSEIMSPMLLNEYAKKNFVLKNLTLMESSIFFTCEKEIGNSGQQEEVLCGFNTVTKQKDNYPLPSYETIQICVRDYSIYWMTRVDRRHHNLHIMGFTDKLYLIEKHAFTMKHAISNFFIDSSGEFICVTLNGIRKLSVKKEETISMRLKEKVKIIKHKGMQLIQSINDKWINYKESF